VAAALILLERTGKAVRSPSKSALLARVAAQTGQGRGFAVHKTLDQVGAFAGPLLLAGVAAVTGLYWPGFALLAVPGLLSLLLLAQLRRRVPLPTEPDPHGDAVAGSDAQLSRGVLRGLGAAVFGSGLPRVFFLFSLSSALTTAGLMTFGLISYRFVGAGLVSLAAVPVVYALAMAVQAVAALLSGDLFDRWGPRVLLGIPVLTVLVPVTVFSDRLWLVLVGVVVWGAGTGMQDSTVKAYVASIVTPGRRATAYGVFAAVQGVGALLGGVLAGVLVVNHASLLAVVVAVLQVSALSLLLLTVRSRPAG
jgi:MFS-type transporter involved in bile tolerance (Atg22 family)